MNLEEASTDEKNRRRKSKKKSAETTKVGDGDESRSCSFTDEDYIVFCFNDDGGIVLAEINKKSGKLPPDDDREIDINEITEGEDTSTKWKSMPHSLSGSTRSNSSSSSFAFPVMNWEMKCSPERMPKLEEWRMERQPESEEERRHIGWRNIRFLCCRI